VKFTSEQAWVPGDPCTFYKIVVLASGNGSNFQAIVDQLQRRILADAAGAPVLTPVAGTGNPPVMGALVFDVVLMSTDGPGAPVIQRAWSRGVPTAVLPYDAYDSIEAHDLHLIDAVRDSHADLVVMAGYMRLVTPAFVQAFAGRLINVHPALLPSFKGTKAIAAALEYGVKVTGVTVHYVEQEMDSGPIIAQEPVRVLEGDTVQSLAERIHAVEHRLLPETIRQIAAGKVMAPQAGSRVVRVED
jgi:phosphoribosylglycinamide formyltransferase-1